METSQTSETQTRALNTPIDGLIRRIANRVGGSKAKEVERFIKFAMVGTLGAVVDLGTMNLLQATVLPPVNELGEPIGMMIGETFLNTNVALAVTISFIAAITSNFTWNRFWTYPDSRSRSIRRQLTQFATVSVIGWLARTTWITASHVALGGLVVGVFQLIQPEFTATSLTSARLGTNLATLIGIFIVMIWNFFANRYWTYNDVD